MHSITRSNGPAPHLARVVGRLAPLAILAGCLFGPSSEQISCYQGCAREKDACLLSASDAAGVTKCDAASRACDTGCRS